MPRNDRAWVGRLDAAEQAALSESESFFSRPDGRLRKALGQLGRPLDLALKATPQGFQNLVTSSLHTVLSTVASGAEAGNYPRDLVDEICARSGRELEPWERIFTVELAVLEKIALERIETAKRLAVVQGGITGMAGAPGLVADVPSLYYLIFRTVNQVAICFGYPADTDAERMYLMQVVNAGHHLEWRDRRCALLELDALEAAADEQGSSEDLQRTLLAKTVQQLARKLAATLIRRKAAQTIAIVGGAVGAAINRQLVDDVGQAAFHAYRRRFLKGAAEDRAATKQSSSLENGAR